MTPALVSILIPAYNAAPWIGQCIQSALAQTWLSTEIIVVDDGSTDDTAALARHWGGSRVQVIVQPNRGAAAARNRAFEAASGQYIQYLDADDLLAPDKIEAQMNLLLAAGDQTISSSAWGMFLDTASDADLLPTALWTDFSDPVEWLILAWTRSIWMQPTAWLTHRRLIEQAGPWNEELSLHDDGEFFCRVLLAADSIAFCGTAKSWYRKGLAESLSSIRNAKAVASHFRICHLYEKHIRAKEDSPRTRAACAANYQYFVYEYFPHYQELTAAAQTAVKRLGGTDVSPHGSPLFMKLCRLVGWKQARRMEKFAYRNGLNPTAIAARLRSRNN